MNKQVLLLLTLLISFPAFSQSPAKLIERQEYDRAIANCVDKLAHDKGNKDKLYPPLKTAFDEANRQDLDKIILLKSTGSPDMWTDVFHGYFRLQQRYMLVSTIEEKLQRDHVNIQLVDYNTDLEASRQNAVAYLYAHSVSLLKTGSKEDAAQAYKELLQLTKIQGEYKDVELLMRQAIGGSANLAWLDIRNVSKSTLSPDFIAGIEDISLSFKEKQYLDYVVKPVPGQDYPLTLSVRIKSVVATPGTVSEKEYTASHKNPESFESAYDDEAKKAADRKHPDYNKCKIKEIYQVKSATIKGTLSYIDSKSGRVLYQVPITARALFENKTATAEGDMFACPPEVYELLDVPKEKFPTNGEMITKAGKELKTLLHGIIWNEAFIK